MGKGMVRESLLGRMGMFLKVVMLMGRKMARALL